MMISSSFAFSSDFAFAISWSFSSGINGLTYKYIKNTYNTEKSLYFILALEAIFVTIGALFTSFVYVGKALPPTHFVIMDGFICSAHALLTFMFGALQTLLYFIISLIRFKRMSIIMQGPWFNDTIMIQRTTWAFFIYLSLLILMTGFNGILDLGLLSAYGHCMHLPDSPNADYLGLILVALPIMTMSIATTCMDIYCFFVAKNQPHASNNTEMPFRVSVISTSITILTMMTVAITIRIKEFQDQFTFVSCVSVCAATIRSPLISLCGFRVNEVNMQVDADEERERKRQIEVQHALQNRRQKKREEESKF